MEFDRGFRTMNLYGYEDVTEEDVLFYTMYTKVTTIPDEYIPDTIARVEQIVKPDWDTVDESAATAILNKPDIGCYNIKSQSSNVGATLTLPTFDIPPNTVGAILKVFNLTIENCSDDDIVYINDSTKKLTASTINGANLMIRLYLNQQHGEFVLIVSKPESNDECIAPVIAFGIGSSGWDSKQIKIYCTGKTIKCSKYGFFSV